MIIIAGSSSSTHASEELSKETLALIDNKMVTLVKGKKFDDAFALFNHYKLNKNYSYSYWKGLFLGSGVLSTGKDSCAAIINFEKSHEKNIPALAALNFEYGGDWISIAAVEGNRQALFDLGFRTLGMEKNTPMILFYDDTLQIKEAYRYFFNAAELGHLEAKKYLVRLEKRYPDIDFTKHQIKIKFKEIHCPVRQY